MRVGGALAGLEAAHIKWHQAGGPDVQPNGLALCSLHHKLFDLGAFMVRTDRTLVISELVSGGEGFTRLMLDFHGEKIRPPQAPDYSPGAEYVEWHEREVFREPARWFR